MYFSRQSSIRTATPDARYVMAGHSCSHFGGHIDVRRVGEFECARITQLSAEFAHLDYQRSGPEYLLVLQGSGHSRIEQLGRIAELEPGDMTIVDSARPYRFKFVRKTIQLTLIIPRLRFDQVRSDWQARLATPLPGSTAAVVGTLLRSCFEHVSTSKGSHEKAVADAVMGLLSSAWDEAGSAAAGALDDDMPTLLRAIQQYVIAHLRDEALAPRTIAQAHHISERQLHRLFQTVGVSVCRWIRQSRLDRCAAQFADRTQRDRSITDIAFSCGFNDAAHFSRLFRAEFRQTPSQYRESALRPRLAMIQ